MKPIVSKLSCCVQKVVTGEIQNACPHEIQLTHLNRTVNAARKSNPNDSHYSILNAGIRLFRIVTSYVTRYNIVESRYLLHLNNSSTCIDVPKEEPL